MAQLKNLMLFVFSNIVSNISSAPGTSSTSSLEVFTGDTLTLYCPLYVTNNSVILWSKDDRIMFAGSLRVRMDDRYHVINDNLIVNNVQAEDAGSIKCQVEDEKRHLQRFTYNVRVLQPPEVKIAVGSYLTVKQGTSLSLDCVGSGVPLPEIRWRKGSKILSRGIGEAGVLLEYITREDAGDIVCEASNGVGDTATDTLTLDVLHAPEVEMIEPHLSFHPKCGLELQCVIHSSSIPSVEWMHNDMLLEPKDGVTMWSLDNLHVLQLSRCDYSILGQFSCNAENNLGGDESSVQISKDWLEQQLENFKLQENINNVRRNVDSAQQTLQLKSSTSSYFISKMQLFVILSSQLLQFIGWSSYHRI